jgi:PAS domain S-box-containing protein
MWLASIVESSEDAIISKDLDGVITSWNNAAQMLFGYVGEEVIGNPVTIIIPPERRHEEDMILERIRCGERVQQYETVRRRKNGGNIDISLTVSPIKGTAGRIVGASEIVRAITESKRNEAQIAVVAREVEHRSENLLANVSAMVRLSESDSPQALKDAIEGRIGALANVHSLFVQSRWMGAELGVLVRQELSPYCLAMGIRTEIDGPAVMLKPDLAQAIAVVLHELASNSAKYGALSTTAGQVRVAWRRTSNGNVVLRWTEAGGPPLTPPPRKSLGSSVVEGMIGAQIGGDVVLEWRAEGLACQITLPI